MAKQKRQNTDMADGGYTFGPRRGQGLVWLATIFCMVLSCTRNGIGMPPACGTPRCLE